MVLVFAIRSVRAASLRDARRTVPLFVSVAPCLCGLPVPSVPSVVSTAQERVEVVQPSVFHDALHAPQISDVRQWIAVDDHEVRELSGLDAPELVANAHR